MIRLATAHAKARMSRTVTAEDAEAAIELVQYAYFKKVLEKQKKKRRRESAADDDDDEEEEEVSDHEQRPKRTRSQAKQNNFIFKRKCFYCISCRLPQLFLKMTLQWMLMIST